MFQLNASVFMRVEVMKTDDNCSIQLKCQRGYLIWKLVSENSLFRLCRSQLRSNHIDIGYIYISQKYSLSEFY